MMFQRAVKMKLRFPSQRGRINVEDLWDLNVRELDGIFKTLNRQARVLDEESLLDSPSAADTKLRLQIKIVTHIVEAKLAEQESRLNRAEKSARKEKLLAILEAKQDAELHDLSTDELQALIDA